MASSQDIQKFIAVLAELQDAGGLEAFERQAETLACISTYVTILLLSWSDKPDSDCDLKSVHSDLVKLVQPIAAATARGLQLGGPSQSTSWVVSSSLYGLLNGLVLYVNVPWGASNEAAVKMQIASRDYLPVYAPTCASLIQLIHGMDSSTSSEQHDRVSALTIDLLMCWRKALKLHGLEAVWSNKALTDIVLPTLQLVRAALQTWGNGSISRNEGKDGLTSRKAVLDAALFALEWFVSALVAIAVPHLSAPTSSLRNDPVQALSALDDVQWAVSVQLAVMAQALHQHEQGLSPAGYRAAVASSTNGSTTAGQLQRLKVAPYHKRLLEGLSVPDLIGWQFDLGPEPTGGAAGDAAGAALIAWSVLSKAEPGSTNSSNSTASSRQDSNNSCKQRFMTATIYLRRLVVVVELCALAPTINNMHLMSRSILCDHAWMHDCLLKETGNEAAALARTTAAVGSGVNPVLLQLMLPALLHAAEEAAADAAEITQAALADMACVMAVFLGVNSASKSASQQLLTQTLQQQQLTTATALETVIRTCSTVLCNRPLAPGLNIDESLINLQLLAYIAMSSVVSIQMNQPLLQPLVVSPECFGLLLAGLKATCKAAAATADLRGSRAFRVMYAMMHISWTAEFAASADQEPLISSDSVRQTATGPAWCVLAAHCMQRIDSVMQICREIQLPASPQQLQRQYPTSYSVVLRTLSHLLAAVQDIAMQLPEAVETAQAPIQHCKRADSLQPLLDMQKELNQTLTEACQAAVRSTIPYRGRFTQPDDPRSALAAVAGLVTAFNADLVQQLQSFGAAVAAELPVKLCCNNPSCSNTDGLFERELVGGKSCRCAGCKVARYCSRACQLSHWKLHKPICNKFRAAAATATSTDQPS